MEQSTIATNFISGIHSEYVGKKIRTLGDIETYLRNPVGVGEHGCVSDELIRLFDAVGKYDGIISSVEKYFMQNKSAEGSEADKELNA